MKFTKKMLSFSAVYFVLFVAEAISYCLAITYLTKIGYATLERSAMFTLAAVFGIVAQLTSGYLCDKLGTIKKLVFVVSFIYMGSTFVLYSVQSVNYLIHFVAVTLLSASLRVIAGLCDSWVLESGSECRDNYGSIRLFGSLGWAAGTSLVGYIADNYGYGMVGLAFLIVMGLTMVMMLFIGDANKQSGGNNSISMADVKMLVSKKTYLYTVGMLFFAYLAVGAHDYVIVDKMNLMGVSASQIGSYWTFCASLELPLFLFGNRLMAKFGAENLFGFAIVVMVIRWVGYGLAGSYLAMLAVASLQFFTYPIFQCASKELIDVQSPDNLKSTGQQVGLALYSAIPSLITPTLTGVLETTFSVNITIYIVALMVSFSLFFLYLLKRTVA